MTRFSLRQFGRLWYVPALLILACASLAASAQSSGEVIFPQAPVNPHFPDDGSEVGPPDGMQAMRRLRLLNTARQKAMVSDAARLLALARELNNDLTEKRNSISPAEQMKKIAEIEKLARNVKERMSYVEGMAVSPRSNLMNSEP